MTIGQRLAKTARKALEELAAREFSRAKIEAACTEAAAKGFVSCEIRPSVPVDVSTSEHMTTLAEVLKKEWLQLTWIPRAMPGEPAYKILEIRWDTSSPPTSR